MPAVDVSHKALDTVHSVEGHGSFLLKGGESSVEAVLFQVLHDQSDHAAGEQRAVTAPAPRATLPRGAPHPPQPPPARMPSRGGAGTAAAAPPTLPAAAAAAATVLVSPDDLRDSPSPTTTPRHNGSRLGPEAAPSSPGTTPPP